MARVALFAVLLLAGSLYPVLRHQPWKFAAERQAIGDMVGRYPKLRLAKMKVLDPEEAAAAERRWDPGNPARSRWGLHLKVHVDPFDSQSLTAFRRELKNHPMLAKSFASEITSFDCGWWVAGEEPVDIPVDFLLLTR